MQVFGTQSKDQQCHINPATTRRVRSACRSAADHCRPTMDVLGLMRMPAAASAPRPPRLPADLERGGISALDHDTTYADAEFTNLVLRGQHASGVTFQAAKLGGVDLTGSQLEGLGIADVEINGCELANLQGTRAQATRTTVARSRLTGIVLTEGDLCDITVRDCRVDLASFAFGRLARVTFEDCMLARAHFLESRLESVRFHRCDLTKSDFRGAQLKQCEFRRSDLTGVQGIESLRGSAMEWGDIVGMAGVWAAALGIQVLDRD